MAILENGEEKLFLQTGPAEEFGKPFSLLGLWCPRTCVLCKLDRCLLTWSTAVNQSQKPSYVVYERTEHDCLCIVSIFNLLRSNCGLSFCVCFLMTPTIRIRQAVQKKAETIRRPNFLRRMKVQLGWSDLPIHVPYPHCPIGRGHSSKFLAFSSAKNLSMSYLLGRSYTTFLKRPMSDLLHIWIWGSPDLPRRLDTLKISIPFLKRLKPKITGVWWDHSQGFPLWSDDFVRLEKFKWAILDYVVHSLVISNYVAASQFLFWVTISSKPLLSIEMDATISHSLGFLFHYGSIKHQVG